jgi:hypothetical protein
MVDTTTQDQEVVEENLLDEIIPLDDQESEEDLLGKISFQDAVSMNTDWTIDTLNGQLVKGNINLMPEFQRRTAWDNVRKSRLIESIIVGLPVPNIVLAEDKEKKGCFIVIDGKQRLVSISEFYSDGFALQGVDLRSDLIGKRYSEISKDDQRALDNSTLRSTLIRNWTDEKFLYTMFFRLNSGSLPLSPQELRKALIGGRLLTTIESYLVESKDFQSVFGTKLDKRMRDSELVLRFLAFDKRYPNYSGNLKEFFDETTLYYEDASKAGELDAALKKLDTGLAVSKQIFDQHVFRKFLGDAYERRMNRAIFDCVIRFNSDQSIAGELLQNSAHIVQAFEAVSVDPQFKESVERTTKSIGSTKYRIDTWGTVLAGLLNKTYHQESASIQ